MRQKIRDSGEYSMNVGGGEAADQLVRMILSGAEFMFKISGSAFKDALAIGIALSKENKKISGKINLGKMLRQTRDIRTFSMSPEQYERFRKQAKKQKILFSAVKDKDKKGAVVDVILPATEVERANQIFERIHYDPKKGPENPPPEAEKPKHWWQKIFRKRGKSKEKAKDSEAKPETVVEQDSPVKSGENQNPTTPDAEEKPGPETKTEPVVETKAEPETEPKIVEEIPIPTAAEPIILPVKEASRESVERAGPVIPIPIRAVTLEPAEKPEKNSGSRPERDGPPQEPRGNDAAQPEKLSQNGAVPSERASQNTSDKSKPAPDRTIINKKPSVLKRLETYRQKIEKDQAKTPSREQKRDKGPSKGGERLADKSDALTASGNEKGGKRLVKGPKKVR